MAFHLRFAYPPGSTLTYAVERVSDGLLFDFGSGAFSATPSTASADVVELSGFPGLYAATIATTPQSSWPDGYYLAIVVDADAGRVVGAPAATMVGGDDLGLPTGGGGGSGPSAAAIASAVWTDPLNAGDFATPGTVGALHVQTLNARLGDILPRLDLLLHRLGLGTA